MSSKSKKFVRRAVFAGGLSAVALVGTVMTVQADHPRFDRGRGGMHRGPMMLEKFDANDDGKVTRKEVEAHNSKNLKDHDGDKSGALSISEFEALWLKRHRHKMVRSFQHLDSDGDGQVTKDELGERGKRMFHRLDRDDDGVITKEESRPRRHRMFRSRDGEGRGKWRERDRGGKKDD